MAPPPPAAIPEEVDVSLQCLYETTCPPVVEMEGGQLPAVSQEERQSPTQRKKFLI